MKRLPGLPCRSQFGVAALVVLALATGALRGAEQTDSPVIELPRFVVTDSRELPPPESWRYATIPGFEVLTNASDRATQRLLENFDMFRQALDLVWQLPARPVPTTSLIIAGRGNKFDAFLPHDKRSPDIAYASLFLRQDDRRAIVIDLEATTLKVFDLQGITDSASGVDGSTVSVEHDKQLYREYIRYLLSRSQPRLPAWYEEGVAQIAMKMKVYRRWIEFAKLEDPNTVPAGAAAIAQFNAAATEDGEGSLPGAPAEDRDFSAALHRRALVPLDRFFAVTHESPEYLNALGNNVWGKQAYAFVHLCLYGARGKFQKPFAKFLERAARERVTEPMFQECFGMSYKQMLLQIRGYCDYTSYESKLFRAKKGGPDLITPPPAVTFREATQSEIGRIKGEALLLAGHEAAARTEFIAPYIRGERDADLLASLGLHELRAGQPDRARKFLEAAVTGKTQRPEAAIELARLRYTEGLAHPETDGRLSAEQVARVIEPLVLARRQRPVRFALYDLAGDTCVRGPTQPKSEHVALLIEGAQLFPTKLKLVYQAATIAAAAREFDAAHTLADHGITYAPDAATKQRFHTFKAALPARPTPPAAAASSPPP